MGYELEVVARRNVDDGAADALHASISRVALLGGAEELVQRGRYARLAAPDARFLVRAPDTTPRQQ